LNGLPKVYDAVDSLGLAYQRSLSGNHISARQRMVSKLEAMKMPAYEARALRYYDQALVSSPVDQQFIARWNGNRIPDVLPNGVDLDFFAFCKAERQPERVLFVGKMSYHANVSSILWFYEEVLPLVRKVIPSVRVDIVGRNPNAKIKALARDPMVEVTGAVADVRPYFHRAAAAICPMVSGSGIQNKMLEAMAAGTAVVATPIAAQSMPVKAGEHLLVGENAGQFADAVIELIVNPSLRGELAIRARAYVEDHHNWQAITQRLEGAYLELLSIKETKHG
jgi:glycosyltransferase involved in cell wall biosynthesis